VPSVYIRIRASGGEAMAVPCRHQAPRAERCLKWSGMPESVPPENSNALSKAIAELLDNPELSARLGRRIRAVHQHFTWRRAAEKTVQAPGGHS